MKLKYQYLLLSLLFTLGASAQVVKPDSVIQTNTPAISESSSRIITEQELGLSKGIFYIAILAFFSLLILSFINKDKDNVIEILKYYCLLFIIIGAIFLVTAGYGNEQISPIVGLLGTVAGYLLSGVKSKKK